MWHELGYTVGTANYHIQHAEKESDKSSNWGWYVGAGGVLVAIVIAAVLFMKMKKPTQEEIPKEGLEMTLDNENLVHNKEPQEKSMAIHHEDTH